MTYKLIPLTTDALVIEDEEILLIKRKKEPFKNNWALPGGFVNYGERVETCCIRELEEETSLKGEVDQLVGVFSDPKRDPRGHVISCAFLLKNIEGKAEASDDAKELKWFNINDLPKLAFDHKEIISSAFSSKR